MTQMFYVNCAVSLYAYFNSTLFPIWGEHQIQSMCLSVYVPVCLCVCVCVCVCVCFQRFLSDNRSPLLEFKLSGDIEDTHISILRKIHNDRARVAQFMSHCNSCHKMKAQGK